MLDADKNEAISLKEFTRFVTKEGEEEKAPKIAGELRAGGGGVAADAAGLDSQEFAGDARGGLVEDRVY